MINNMFLGHKIIVCIPAGRKKTLEILIKYLEREFDIIDEVRFWFNTTNEEDVKYIESFSNKNKFTIDYIAKETCTEKYYACPFPWTCCISLFFRNCVEEDTVYIRLDDDIIFLEENFIRKLSEFRIKNKSNFLVLGNIVNNAVCDYKHISQNEFDIKGGTPNRMDDVLWKDPIIAEKKHRTFLENQENLSIYHFESIIWVNPFSINCISWLGGRFKEFQGNCELEKDRTWKHPHDEELWLTRDRPDNIIFGDVVCSHYSFYPQKEYIDTTDILQKYKELIKI